MVFEHIEKLKDEYTDKYVVVDPSAPELSRFREMTGIVRTVNMNGRALVEFDGHQNIGWYDISLDFLKVVDQPVEKPVVEKPVVEKKAKPAAKPKPKPAQKKEETPAAGGSPMSPAEILAAARGSAAEEKEKPAMSATDVLAAARGTAVMEQKEEKPKTTGSSKEMSVADILAAARGGGSTQPKAKNAEPAQQPEEDAPSPVAEETTVTEENVPTPTGELPTNVEDILKFCRERDGR